MRKLKTLEEHNNEKRAEYSASVKACPTGIACPDCGAGLWTEEWEALPDNEFDD